MSTSESLRRGESLVCACVLALVVGRLAPAACIRGNVIKAGGAAVVGGFVAAYDEYGSFVNSTTTDVSGNYALCLSPGTYYLHARGGSSNSFLVTISYDGNAGNVGFYASHGRLGELQPVTLGETDATGIDFQLLTVGGKVTGKVYAANGVTAVSGATVQLCDEAGLLVETTAAPTDAAGNFTLNGVPPGTYVLDAFPPTDSYHVAATYHTPFSLGYGVWYADNLANATRITVTANVTRANTNFQLPAGGKICGNVTSGGFALPDIIVTAYDAYGHAAGSAGSTFSGAYSVGAILPGTFYLDARGYSANPTYITVAYDGLPWTVNYYWNRGRAGELTPVNVTVGQCTPNINFAMTDGGGGIEGTVTDAYSGDPIGSAPVTLFDQYGDCVDGMQTRIDGTYGFYGLEPGEYIAQVDGPGGLC